MQAAAFEPRKPSMALAYDDDGGQTGFYEVCCLSDWLTGSVCGQAGSTANACSSSTQSCIPGRRGRRWRRLARSAGKEATQTRMTESEHVTVLLTENWRSSKVDAAWKLIFGCLQGRELGQVGAGRWESADRQACAARWAAGNDTCQGCKPAGAQQCSRPVGGVPPQWTAVAHGRPRQAAALLSGGSAMTP